MDETESPYHRAVLDRDRAIEERDAYMRSADEAMKVFEWGMVLYASVVIGLMVSFGVAGIVAWAYLSW